MKKIIVTLGLVFCCFALMAQREHVTVGMTGAQVRTVINNTHDHLTICYPNTLNLQAAIDATTSDTAFLQLAEGKYTQNITTTKYLVIIGEPRKTNFNGYISVSKGVFLQGIDFINTTASSIIIFNNTTPVIDGVYIDNCQFVGTSAGTGGASIYYYGGTMSVKMQNVNITNCVFRNGGSAITLSPVAVNVNIENCSFTDLYRPTVDCRCIYIGANDNQNTESGNYLISNCDFKNIGTGQTDISGSTSAILLYGTGVRIENCYLNYIYGESSEAIYTKASNVVLNNIIFRNVQNECIQLKPHLSNRVGNYVLSNISSTRDSVTSPDDAFDIYIDGYATLSNISIKHSNVIGRGIRLLNTDSTNTNYGDFILSNIYIDVIGQEAINASTSFGNISISNMIAKRRSGVDINPLVMLWGKNVSVNQLNAKTANGFQALFCLGSVIKITNSEFTDSLVASGYPTLDFSPDSILLFENNIVNTSGRYQIFEEKSYQDAPIPQMTYIKNNKFYIHPLDTNIVALMRFASDYLEISDNLFEITKHYHVGLMQNTQALDTVIMKGNIFLNKTTFDEPIFNVFGTIPFLDITNNFADKNFDYLVEFKDGFSSDFVRFQNNIFLGNRLFTPELSTTWPYSATPGTLIVKDNFTTIKQNPYVSSGFVHISGGNTSKADIAHGLGYTPLAAQFEFEFIGTAGDVTTASVSSIDGTKFNLNVSPAPGGSGVNIYWRIKNNYTNY
jgi:hypothetical protein